MQQSFNTHGIILKRTNYGEADRILNIITPRGKVAAIAKSARKERSKLAGGIEMFSLVELTIHKGRSNLGVVTSAKMLKHYSGVVKSLEKIEFVAVVLKKVSAVAEHVDVPELFEITKRVFAELDVGTDIRLIESWFWLNLMKLNGEEMNLYRDVRGEKLEADKHYEWDEVERAFLLKEQGRFGANEIKLLRMLSGSDFGLIKRIRLDDGTIGKTSEIVKFIKNN